MTDNHVPAPERFIDGQGILLSAGVLVIVILLRAWDAVQAVGATDMVQAFKLYYVEPSRIIQLAPLFFGLVVIGSYFAWLSNALRVRALDTDRSKIPTPGTAIIQHILPPFLFFRPYAIARTLMADKANDLVLTLWWGGFWGGIALYALRFTITLDNGAPANMTFWLVTLLMWLAFAISSACLVYLSRTITQLVKLAN